MWGMSPLGSDRLCGIVVRKQLEGVCSCVGKYYIFMDEGEVEAILFTTSIAWLILSDERVE